MVLEEYLNNIAGTRGIKPNTMLRLTGSSSLMDKTAVPLRRAWAERQAKEWADCLNCPLTVERSVFGVSNRETEGVS